MLLVVYLIFTNKIRLIQPDMISTTLQLIIPPLLV